MLTSPTRAITTALSRKISGLGTLRGASYQQLLVSSIEGSWMPEVGGIFPGAWRRTGGGGDPGVEIGDSAEQLALVRWQMGRFTEAEAILSERWRDVTREFDLEAFADRVKSAMKGAPKVASLAEAREAAEEFMRTDASPARTLRWLLDELVIGDRVQDAVMRRWSLTWPRTMAEFSPYAAHLATVLIAFYLGLQSQVVKKLPTNRLDLEYVFYLPFCDVFTSQDNFQTDLARAFLESPQLFIPAQDLKGDMKAIASWWNGLDDAGREEAATEQGFYPPDLPGSPTAEAWRRFMPPWKPGSGNRANRMTAEERRDLGRRIRARMRDRKDEPPSRGSSSSLYVP